MTYFFVVPVFFVVVFCLHHFFLLPNRFFLLVFFFILIACRLLWLFPAIVCCHIINSWGRPIHSSIVVFVFTFPLVNVCNLVELVVDCSFDARHGGEKAHRVYYIVVDLLLLFFFSLSASLCFNVVLFSLLLVWGGWQRPTAHCSVASFPRNCCRSSMNRM